MKHASQLLAVSIATLLSNTALATVITTNAQYSWLQEGQSGIDTKTNTTSPETLYSGVYGDANDGVIIHDGTCGECGYYDEDDNWVIIDDGEGGSWEEIINYRAVYGSARGNTTGVFGMNVGAYNGSNYQASASYAYQNSFSNSATTDQLFSLALQLDRGSVYYGNTSGSDSFGSSSMLAQIFVNDVLKWQSGTSLTSNASGISASYVGDFNTRSFEVSYSPQDRMVKWNAMTIDVDLGIISASSTFDFKYVVTVALDNADTTSYKETHLFAQFGDPFHFTTTPITQSSFSASSASAVPAPASIALLGLGVVALRRFRTKR